VLFAWRLLKIGNYSVPFFEKEGVRGDFLNKSPLVPLFQRGRAKRESLNID